MRISCWTHALVGICFALTGVSCASKLTPTKGTITIAGKPLAKATVLFIADDAAGKDATGITDSNGFFELTTSKLKDGALPGSYKIVILHAEPPDLPSGLKTPDDFRDAVARAPVKASIVPEMYSRSDQTPLRHRVPQDGEVKIDLPRSP